MSHNMDQSAISNLLFLRFFKSKSFYPSHAKMKIFGHYVILYLAKKIKAVLLNNLIFLLSFASNSRRQRCPCSFHSLFGLNLKKINLYLNLDINPLVPACLKSKFFVFCSIFERVHYLWD